MIVDITGNDLCADGYTPHRDTWERFLENVSDDDFERVKSAFNNKIDELLNKDAAPVIEAAWLTGSDWWETDFMPLYYAAKESAEQAGYYAGLFLWFVLVDRDERWVMWQDPERDCRQYFLANNQC